MHHFIFRLYHTCFVDLFFLASCIDHPIQLCWADQGLNCVPHLLYLLVKNITPYLHNCGSQMDLCCENPMQ